MSVLAGPVVASWILLLASTTAFGQQPAPTTPGPDTLQQLLAEVRQLRATVERAASESSALQLVAVRAAMQEERLYRVSRDVDTLRTTLLAASREAQAAAENLKQFEASIADEVDAGRRQALQNEVPMLRVRVQTLRQAEQQLQQQEAAMTDSMTTEEGRWRAINARLDEIERRLADRTR
jgi:hypothetical protein